METHDRPADESTPHGAASSAGATAPHGTLPLASPAAANAPRRRGLRMALTLGSLVLLLGLIGALVGGLFWAAGSAPGTRWLLGQLERFGVQVIEPEGLLLGDLKARQIIITSGGTRVVIDRPGWRAMSARYTPYADTWVSLHADSLVASRVTVTSQPSQQPFTLPQRLRLPLELAVDEVRVDELQVPGLEDHPLRELRGRVALGSEQGAVHRIDQLSLRLDPLRITGQASIGTDGPLPLQAELNAVQSDTANSAPPTAPWAKALSTGWQAKLTARGPLARFETQAQLRAQGQSLDADALVAPADSWPLPRLHATTQGLDLSALFDKAPATALTGDLRITPETLADGHALQATARLDNAKPGRWDLRQLPLRSLQLNAHARTGQTETFELREFQATLSDGGQDAGELKGQGQWTPGQVMLKAELGQVRPALLDPRLPAMALSGPVTLTAERAPQAPSGGKAWPRFSALADLKGRLNDPAQPVQLKLDASGNEDKVELRELLAAVGSARASAKGVADHEREAWQVKAQATLVEFDPRPWFPRGPGGGWQAGQYRFNLNGHTTLTLPDSLWNAPAANHNARPAWAAVRGEAAAELNNSVLGGVAVSGDMSLAHGAPDDPLRARAALDVAGNQIKLDGEYATDAQGQRDRWATELHAPMLARLAPLARLFLTPEQAQELLPNLGGTVDAEAQLNGRWPAVTTQGKATLANVQAGPWRVGQASLRWDAGSALDAPLNLLLDVGQAAWNGRQLGASALELKGTPRAHDLTLRAELKAAPPAWVDNLQGPVDSATGARTSPASVAAAAATPAASAPTNNSPPPANPSSANPNPNANSKATPTRTLLLLAGRGGLNTGLLGGDPQQPLTWKGVMQQLELRTTEPGTSPLLVTRNVVLEFQGGAVPKAMVGAGRADILGAGLRWNRIDWQADQGVSTQQLDMQAELEPLAVAPLLRRLQPNFGWGGDLQIAGKVILKQTDEFSADIVLERTRGDLTVTEESGTQPLGLTDLRIGMTAQNGVWSFTAGLAGEQLGVLGGAAVVRTSPKLAWPAPDAPVQGVLEAQVANLGTWGPWVPAGWRLDGKLNISASLGGRMNAPEYTGVVKGSDIGVRNMLEGVSITDGEVDIALRGDTAKINKLTARGGAGTVRLEGEAKLDNGWRSNLMLYADKFQLLGRVDLRIVTSGQAQVQIENDSVNAEGKFVVDEGLADFTRLSSPSLGDDVIVTGRPEQTDAPPAAPSPTGAGKIHLNLLVNLGERLRMRGLGIDTGLRGELKVSRPLGKWTLQGLVNAVDGTFANYGQKLTIDRGVITFNGAPSDMRLDIEATRPNLDVRVGVQVTGVLANLRVRLFSVPDMTNNEKLSWLLLGRASEGLGKSDTALLQRAAFALLSGDGDSGPGQITKTLGIDEVGIRSSEGDTKETVVSVGKQLSKRVYIAYEQNLNTSTGSVQVVYRIAQRFVMRLQSGLDRSVDLIGTWRWE